MGSILWLASYPKSGNTWIRILLTNYQRDEDEPANINKLNDGPIASSRDLFDEMIGFEASELTDKQIAQLRPVAYRRLAEELDELSFIKTHDAWTLGPTGAPIFPPDVTAGVIYILRNPLDVAVSAANHWGSDVAQAVQNLCNPDFEMARSNLGLSDQLKQRMLDWSGHALSWIEESGLPVHVVRFEDLKANTEQTFAGVVEFAGWPLDPERIAKAVRFSDFCVVKQQEEEAGFRERPLKSSGFFREGRVGSGQEALTSTQITQIYQTQGPTMARFGYYVPEQSPAE